MKEIYEFLRDIQYEVGCGCSVSVWIDETIGMRLRIDWPEDLHLLYQFTRQEIESIAESDFLKEEIIDVATREYKLKTIGEE